MQRFCLHAKPEYDLNGDGEVDPFEAFACAMVDVNGDGTLDAEERAALVQVGATQAPVRVVASSTFLPFAAGRRR